MYLVPLLIIQVGTGIPWLVVGKSVVTSRIFSCRGKVLSVKEVPPDDGLYSAEIKVSKKSNNDTAVSEAAVIVGASRNAQKYNIVRNDVDWDVYGDTFTYRGDWDENTTYETGNIVTRYDQAYICKQPTGAGTTFFGELAASNTNVQGSVLGPCTISRAVDPYWDYTDNWDVYMTGEPLHEKKNKILYFPRFRQTQLNGKVTHLLKDQDGVKIQVEKALTFLV